MKYKTQQPTLTLTPVHTLTLTPVHTLTLTPVHTQTDGLLSPSRSIDIISTLLGIAVFK